MEEGIEQLIDMVAKLKVTVEEGLRDVNRRLDEHDGRFEKIEKKLAEHDERFDKIEKKLAEHDERFEKIEKKQAEHDERFDKIEELLDRNTRNQEKMIKTIRVNSADIKRNTRHIDKLENKDEYLVSE